MTTCRLATRQTVKAKQICVDAGVTRTYIAIYNDAGIFCATEMQCCYDPDCNKNVPSYVLAFRNAQKKKSRSKWLFLILPGIQYHTGRQIYMSRV